MQELNGRKEIAEDENATTRDTGKAMREKKKRKRTRDKAEKGRKVYKEHSENRTTEVLSPLVRHASQMNPLLFLLLLETYLEQPPPPPLPTPDKRTSTRR